MNKALLLKLHRWIALIFALPLAIVILTGLILSAEPLLVAQAIKPGSLTPAAITQHIPQAGPSGLAGSIYYRAFDNTLTIGGGRGAKGTVLDATTGAAAQPSATAQTLSLARGLHEHLLMGNSIVVIASTMAMLAILAAGTIMGWPRLSNTVSGWHQATAWGLLPLLILSPLAGLFIAFGVTFTSPPPQAPSAPVTLTQAINALAKDHDLSGLVWIRTQGNRMMARLVEDGEYKVFAVTAGAATPLPRNWPRLWHEGNFAGSLSSAMNIAISLALTLLTGTGLWIWTRRQFRRRTRNHQTQPA